MRQDLTCGTKVSTMCHVNHTTNVKKKEIDSITNMYVRYVGDGDCKTFKGILSLQAYGEQIIVQKKEWYDRFSTISTKTMDLMGCTPSATS